MKRLRETDFNFYCGLPLTLQDIVFPWLCRKAEAGGCLLYETRRQIFGRALHSRQQSGDSARISQLRAYWLKNFKLPWKSLDQASRDKWHKRHSKKFDGERTNQTIPLWLAERGEKDPKPNWPGEVYSVKLDWDLSPDDLVQRFANAVRRIHPRPKMRTRTTQDALTAIAAQRILDLHGPHKVTSMIQWARTQASLKGYNVPLFSSVRNLHRAAKRYRESERDLRIGSWESGDFDILLTPVRQSED